MKSELRIGVDIGAVTIGVAALEDGNLVSKAYRFHHGDVKSTLAEISSNLQASGSGREFGVPVIHLFYDGIHSPNENLEPYIHYLRKEKISRAEKREERGWAIG
ncbi:MAG: hypothetical protein AB1715_01065 [Acidobacteriota bacterium]